MIIAVQGTRYGNNGAAKILSALAVAGVHKDQKSTLILQFMNRTRKNVENYLVGQKLRNESLVQDTSVSDPTVGMDALCANTSFTTYSAELFSEVTKSLVSSNVPNVFDVAYSSRKESFERELLNKNKVSGEDEQSYLETILKAADKVYDMVYVLVPSKNEQLATQITQLAEVNVVCVHQGMKEDVIHGAQREYYIITDYCAGSAYNSKTLAQAYGQKVIYGGMHNVLFNDACIDGLALQFLDKNMDATKNDYNYPFIHNITLLYNIIVRHKERKQPEGDPSVLKKYEGPKIIESIWEPITASVVTKVVTTGFINKTVTKNNCLVADASNEKLPMAEPEVEEDIALEPVEDELPPEELPDFGDENIFDHKESVFDDVPDDDSTTLEPVEIPASIDEFMPESETDTQEEVIQTHDASELPVEEAVLEPVEIPASIDEFMPENETKTVELVSADEQEAAVQEVEHDIVDLPLADADMESAEFTPVQEDESSVVDLPTTEVDPTANEEPVTLESVEDPAPKKGLFGLFNIFNKKEKTKSQPVTETVEEDVLQPKEEPITDTVDEEEIVDDTEFVDKSEDIPMQDQVAEISEEIETSEKTEEAEDIIAPAINLPDIFDDNTEADTSEQPVTEAEPEPELETEAGIAEVITPVKKRPAKKTTSTKKTTGKTTKKKTTKEPVVEVEAKPVELDLQTETDEETSKVTAPVQKKRTSKKTGNVKAKATVDKTETDNEDDGWTFG